MEIDPTYLRGQIETLQGEARLLRGMIAALMGRSCALISGGLLIGGWRGFGPAQIRQQFARRHRAAEFRFDLHRASYGDCTPIFQPLIDGLRCDLQQGGKLCLAACGINGFFERRLHDGAQ